MKGLGKPKAMTVTALGALARMLGGRSRPGRAEAAASNRWRKNRKHARGLSPREQNQSGGVGRTIAMHACQGWPAFGRS